MSFEPFRSVVVQGKALPSGTTPPPGFETRTIILEGPALDPEALGTSEPEPTRGMTVARPAARLIPSGGSTEAAAPAATIPEQSAEDTAADTAADCEDPEVRAELEEDVPLVLDPGLASPREPSAPARAPRRAAEPRRPSPATSAATHQSTQQYIVAYDGKLVGTYRSAKRILNRTAYRNVAEQLVGQIEDFDPSRIRLYRLVEVPLPEPIERGEIAESFHTFPREFPPGRR